MTFHLFIAIMQFTGEHARRKVRNGTIKVHQSEERGHHWRHVAQQTKYRNERLAKSEARKWRNDMQLLTNEPKLNEGRGRSAVDSTFNVDGLLEATGTETMVEAAEAIIALGSPFILAVKGEDWTGTKSGAKADLEAQLVEHDRPDIGASYRQVAKTDPNRKSVFKFTFKRQAVEEDNEEE